MRGFLRKHATTMVVAVVTAMVAGGGSAVAAIVANADKVDGYHANELIRVARSSINDNALVGTNGVIRQVTIKAPKAGFLVMWASSDTFNYVEDDSPICYLALDGTELTSTARQIELDAVTAGANQEEDCSTDGAWPVAAGSHTVAFTATNVFGADTTFDESTLEVMFVPFNGKGKKPVPVAPSVRKLTVNH